MQYTTMDMIAPPCPNLATLSQSLFVKWAPVIWSQNDDQYYLIECKQESEAYFNLSIVYQKLGEE